jgi:hypothetical protein
LASPGFGLREEEVVEVRDFTLHFSRYREAAALYKELEVRDAGG